MKVIHVVAAVLVGAIHCCVPSCCIAKTSQVSTSSRLLHSLDGVPFLMERRHATDRRMRSIISSSSNGNNSQLSCTKTTTTTNNDNNERAGAAPVTGEDVASRRRFLTFGDYVDTTYSCPPTTTCPSVCVASIQDCPEDARCPGTHPDKEEANPDHVYEV